MYALALIASWLTAVYLFRTGHELYAVITYLIVIPLLISLPRFLFWWRSPRLTPRWLRYTERLGLVIVLLNAPGTAYFHHTDPTFQYDRFLHLSIGFLLVPLVLCLLLAANRSAARTCRAIPTLYIILFVGLFAWEGWQFVNDRIFGTHMFWDGAQPIQQDFWEDISFGTVGLLLSIPLVRRMRPRLDGFIRN